MKEVRIIEWKSTKGNENLSKYRFNKPIVWTCEFRSNEFAQKCTDEAVVYIKPGMFLCKEHQIINDTFNESYHKKKSVILAIRNIDSYWSNT